MHEGLGVGVSQENQPVWIPSLPEEARYQLGDPGARLPRHTPWPSHYCCPPGLLSQLPLATGSILVFLQDDMSFLH